MVPDVNKKNLIRAEYTIACPTACFTVVNSLGVVFDIKYHTLLSYDQEVSNKDFYLLLDGLK